MSRGSKYVCTNWFPMAAAASLPPASLPACLPLWQLHFANFHMLHTICAMRLCVCVIWFRLNHSLSSENSCRLLSRSCKSQAYWPTRTHTHTERCQPHGKPKSRVTRGPRRQRRRRLCLLTFCIMKVTLRRAFCGLTNVVSNSALQPQSRRTHTQIHTDTCRPSTTLSTANGLTQQTDTDSEWKN